MEFLEFDGISRIINNEGGIVFSAGGFAGGTKISIPLLNSVIEKSATWLGTQTGRGRSFRPSIEALLG